MAYDTTNRMAGAFELELSRPWSAYWIAFLRVVTGWWLFHAGITKLIESGLNYGYGPVFLEGMSGTSLGWLTGILADMPWLVKPGVPLFETLIGLGLMFGVLTRLASVGGMFFMSLFWVGNAGFAHGVVNGELLGLLLFATMIVFAAGRYYGLDPYLEDTNLVQKYPRLRYLLG